MSVFRLLLKSGLPVAYKAVTCVKITSANGTYIDLPYPYVFGSVFYMDLEPTLYNNNWTTLVCPNIDSISYGRLGYNSEGKAPQCSLMINESNSSNYSGLDQTRYIWELGLLSTSYITVAGHTYTKSGTQQPSYNIRLLATGNNHDRYRGKIYGIVVRNEQGRITMDFRPAVRKRDNRAGLYDIKNKTFYIGTGVAFEYEE